MALCICTQQAVKLMQEKGIDDGQIIHISSIDAHKVPNPGRMESFFYCGTKFMVRALTEGLRRELKAGNSHIRVGSISPAYVETEYFANFSKIPAADISAFFKSFEPIRPKDIADSVLHILSAPPRVEIHDVIIENSI
ncbi:Dehydrogenase/reductase SDR family member 11 [Araneus ventricosus]|uniref:Dehydrogenase/reductase SDR family member 11 n=1 Tax=Araneus ventricosus TaxID=182803 RepID=A0A4Y2P0Q5_ARAVE|nr:Dehydrogenase/reductase SDR family member 11 [Araneus ventricosus]